jgi:nucleotide-binding universal stress UspA family protein
MAIRKILVPVDGSELANRALGFAIERAKVSGAEITVAFVVNRLSVAIATATPYAYVDPTPLLATLDAEADVVLGAAESLVKKSGVSATRAKLDGAAGPEILAYARQACCDLVVMGTHGRRGFDRLAVGSTAEDVIRAAAVPVIAFPRTCERAPNAGRLRHLLVAVDGSPAAEAAMTFACELALVEQAQVTLCAVVEPSGIYWDDLDRDVSLQSEIETKAKASLESERSRAAGLGITAGVVGRVGHAAGAIVSAAHDCGADLVVMGTHGRAGIPRFVLGSVAEGVLRHSPLPICTIRHR